MNKLVFAATTALLLATTSARAGSGISFEIDGQRVRIESPRGEIGCHIVSKGKAEPYRLKFRRPSFVNLQILPKLLIGESMTNLVTILGGIDIVLGEVDC